MYDVCILVVHFIVEARNYVLYLCLCGGGCMSNTICKGAKDFSSSAALNRNMEVAKKE